jgi:hypothetical protein
LEYAIAIQRQLFSSLEVHCYRSPWGRKVSNHFDDGAETTTGVTTCKALPRESNPWLAGFDTYEASFVFSFLLARETPKIKNEKKKQFLFFVF